ncbi:MAG: RNA polymerase sigma factor RpoH [Gammaproteobacteria bacterium]|jgi:RNA polymerase sigma-32 factor|nr:RNA polymerase sigma factor RpoH [Gammaproteobacteria bacterium]|tara:strand:- start:1387 stop:2244 length:858 start_codon:yes stop_codon:yes gene_type:complete
MASAANTASFPVLRSGSLQEYLDTASQIPILSKEQEVDLFLRFQEHEDLDAARKIVMSHLRYVIYIARGYAGYGLPLEDIIQQGNVGLMKSVKKFSLDHDVRLVSFAVHWIKAEIHEYILRNWKIVKVATTKAQRKLFFNLRKAKRGLGWFNRSEVEQVANDLGVKPAEVVEMEARLTNRDESFEPVDYDDEKNFSPSAFITVGESEDPANVTAERQITNIQNQGLIEGLASLDDRARDIVKSRWLSNEKATLKQLSAKYGVSLERIRQIEVKAFEKIQPYLQAA